ncbi:DNA-directed RNA polymerase III subunit RPC9 [Exaiptasia diaphana]|uniref:DNA-directed RNA polymerase III subunit RPC9 n=1 Tax=Exaiptasia diaphana TaxID=2652724 RepID=A0A913XKE5_EXADI|nr:DNA-directed RNA polymerase III subunit RPC9 [Exaiptasia diaphana]KXJ11276.1 DNA-directed RNA polymerase III subunit RPC9 [Exaiptasia diaphana]
MEVLKEKSVMLSNFEVYQLLQEAETKTSKSKSIKKHQVNLATISYEARKYLEKTPCKHQNAEVIEDFLKSLAPFNLTKAEKLQLLNLRPETHVEIQLIIEESVERFKTEEEIQELLDIVAKLPSDHKETISKDEIGDEEMEEEKDNEIENE